MWRLGCLTSWTTATKVKYMRNLMRMGLSLTLAHCRMQRGASAGYAIIVNGKRVSISIESQPEIPILRLVWSGPPVHTAAVSHSC